jgi:hypothetical protein
MSDSKLAPVASHHVIAKQKVGGVSSLVVPALYIEVGGKPTLVTNLIRYFTVYPLRSYDWRRKTARAVGLFYDFSKSHIETRGNKISHRDMVRAFALAYLNGTVTPGSSEDALGLYWPPSSIKAVKGAVSSLQRFTSWCAGEGITSSEAVSGYGVFPSERSFIRYLSTAMKIKDMSFLGYTSKTGDVAKRLSGKAVNKIVDLGTSTDATVKTAKYFPSWLVPDLITEGFIVRPGVEVLHEREDLAAKMITLLMMFGAVRMSEPFHLWFNDVIPQVDGSCKIILQHPSDAQTNLPYEKKIIRKAYLAERGLQPRDVDGLPKTLYAGWKDLAVDQSLQAPVHFIHGSAEVLFREMFIYYLRYREHLIESYKERTNTTHPWLFVSKHGDTTGSPYSIDSYKKALERAYKRLERRKGYTIPRGKNAGTTPHGMRHFAGQSLSDAGVDSKVVQRLLHQRSIFSQQTYTEPSDQRISDELDKARRKLNDEGSLTLTNQIVEALEA